MDVWLHKYSKDFLDETIRVWQPLSKEPLTYADAEEITENMVGYFNTLLRWEAEARQKLLTQERRTAKTEEAPKLRS